MDNVHIQGIAVLDPIDDCLTFFRESKPEPTTNDIHTQIGVHFEEVGEMIEAITPLNEQTSLLLSVAFAALKELGDHLKQNDNIITVLPENRVDFLDALGDQMVTAIGCAYLENMDIAGAFDEINDSNLSKFDADGKAILNENKKIMKGPNYRKADLAQFV